MALLPYLLGDLRPRPRRIGDQLFGLDVSPEEFLTDIFDQPMIKMRKYIRPWKNFAAVARDVGSTIKTDKDKFQVNLDVQHFDPEEISVKTSDGYVVVEGKHEERKDEHGFISRQFKRRYALPEGCNPETVVSRLSSDGVLTVTAPRVARDDERAVPITQTGPVRRKAQEEENGDVGESDAVEEKIPEKKRRRRQD